MDYAVPYGALKAAEQRFWSKVDKSGDCWLWVGTKNQYGYGRFHVDGSLKTAHCVAYELVVGPRPPGMELDHICHNSSCVRPTHLRPATHKQNMENQAGPYSNSKSGVRGVFWYPRDKRWVARIKHDGKTMHIGYYDEIADAEAAVIARRNQLFTNNIQDRK